MKKTKFHNHTVYLSNDPIYVTDDYSIFQKWPGNRPIVQSNVKKIKDSILEVKWMYSSILLLGPNQWIGDGQNRVEALRQIERETGKRYRVKYQVDLNLTLEQIILMNSTSSVWNPKAHLASQIERGMPEYKRLQEYIDKYKIPVYTAAMLATGNNITGKAFREKFQKGMFKCSDWDAAHARAQHILTLYKYFQKAKNSYFILAMGHFWKHPDFNHDMLTHKFEMNRGMLYPCSSVNQYVEMILKVYNYHSQNKLKF